MDIHVLDQLVICVMQERKTVQSVLNAFRKSPLGSCYSSISKVRILCRIEEIKNQMEKVYKLNNYPFVKQRSVEWYEIRNSLITASDFGEATGKVKFGTQNSFFRKKVGYEENTFDSSLPPLQWGIRYEEVANLFYKKMMKVSVFEYGIMKHPTIEFVGASPDGVSNTGVMLEIKCPYNRKNTQHIHDQYVLQIQGQLEVCDLEYCDYLECYIKEYDSLEQCIEDRGNPYIHHQGIVLLMDNGDYVYGELDDLQFSNDKKYNTRYVYAIHDYFIQRVKRDRVLWNKLVKELSDVWDKVVLFRSNKTSYDKQCLKKQKTTLHSKTSNSQSTTQRNMFRDIPTDQI